MDWIVEVPATAFHTELQEINLGLMSQFSLQPGKQSDYALAFKTAVGATLEQTSQWQRAPLHTTGEVKLDQWRVADFAPYYQQALPLTVEDGTLTLSTHYEVALDGENRRVNLQDFAATLTKLRLKQGSGNLVADDSLTLKGAKACQGAQ